MLDLGQNAEQSEKNFYPGKLQWEYWEHICHTHGKKYDSKLEHSSGGIKNGSNSEAKARDMGTLRQVSSPREDGTRQEATLITLT